MCVSLRRRSKCGLRRQSDTYSQLITDMRVDQTSMLRATHSVLMVSVSSASASEDSADDIQGCRRTYAFVLRGRSGVTEAGVAERGVHPAIVRTQARALALSVMPGKRRRSSIAADSSPSWWKRVRIASASASVTRNIPRAWSVMSTWASGVIPASFERHFLLGGGFHHLGSFRSPAQVHWRQYRAV